MKLLVIFFVIVTGCLGSVVVASRTLPIRASWCWPRNHQISTKPKLYSVGNEYASYGSYGSEVDWSNPQRILPLDFEQAQGKRIFYRQCVWCHADTTPAGPSNRSNVSPDPPLMNDGAILNAKSDASLHNVIALGGSAMGKSAMMPPYGMTLTDAEIDDLVAYMRVIASPEYQKPARKRNWIWNENR